MAGRLSYDDRVDIELMLKDDLSVKAIVELKGISRQGLHDERNRGRDKNGKYRAINAQKSLQRRYV